MDLSKGIIFIRKSKKMNQADVADALGMERSNYARLEKRGNKITLEQAELIAKAMGCTIWELLIVSSDEKERPNNQTEVQELRTRIEKLDEEVIKLNYWLKDKQHIIDLLKSVKQAESFMDWSVFEDYMILLFRSVNRQFPNLSTSSKIKFVKKQFLSAENISEYIQSNLFDITTLDQYLQRAEKEVSERIYEETGTSAYITFSSKPEDIN